MNQSNSEIIKATREFRDAMTVETAFIDIAKMLSRSADRLDVTTTALREMTKQCDAKDMLIQQLAAENAALKSKLIFWDWDDPETSYDSPEELAEAFSLNYNEEFTVMVAAKMPNRVYRVCESWEQECKVELVECAEIETPGTDAALAEIRNEAGARAVELFAKTLGSPYAEKGEKCYEDGFTRAIEVVRDTQAPRFAAQLRKGAAV